MQPGYLGRMDQSGPNSSITGQAAAAAPRRLPSGLPLPSGEAEFAFGLAAIGFFAALALLWLLILSGISHPRTQFDQDLFHLRAITEFAAQWPSVSVRDYPSATTPGYHLLLAGLYNLGLSSTLGLRLFSATFAAAIFAIILGWCAARRGPIEGLVLACPVLLCPYVLQSGLYLLPDNAAWMLVALILGAALGTTQTPRRWLALSALLVVLVGVRQLHIWSAAAIWAGAFASAQWPARSMRNTHLAGGGLLADFGGGIRRGLIAGAMTLPAFALLGWFVLLWGGLTPPSFRFAESAMPGDVQATNVGGISPATPAFMLSLLAIYGGLLLPLMWKALRPVLRERGSQVTLIIAAAVGALLAVVPPTTYAMRPRIGGLWNVVRAAEVKGLVIAGHTSPVIVLLAALGAAVVVLLLLCGRPRVRLVLGISLLAFMAAGTAQALSWQRYFEPMLLMWVALAVACRAEADSERRWPPLVAAASLALLMLATSVMAFAGGQ